MLRSIRTPRLPATNIYSTVLNIRQTVDRSVLQQYTGRLGGSQPHRPLLDGRSARVIAPPSRSFEITRTYRTMAPALPRGMNRRPVRNAFACGLTTILSSESKWNVTCLSTGSRWELSYANRWSGRFSLDFGPIFVDALRVAETAARRGVSFRHRPVATPRQFDTILTHFGV